MKCLFSLACAALLAAPSAPPKWSGDIPPPRFNAEGTAVVVFVHPSRIAELCAGVGTPPEGMVIVACTLGAEDGSPPITVMPHPIFWAEDEWFARVMAHELAHNLTGWRHETE